MTESNLFDLRLLLFFVLLFTSVGCGGSEFEFAPVAGIVTLDGEPLPNAKVRFEPMSTEETSVVGPGSFGTTDSEGRYELISVKNDQGAVVGPHVVRIGTLKTRLNPNDLDKVETLAKEVVPRIYNTSTQLTMYVTEEGTSEANFALTAEPSKSANNRRR